MKAPRFFTLVLKETNAQATAWHIRAITRLHCIEAVNHHFTTGLHLPKCSPLARTAGRSTARTLHSLKLQQQVQAARAAEHTAAGRRAIAGYLTESQAWCI